MNGWDMLGHNVELTHPLIQLVAYRSKADIPGWQGVVYMWMVTGQQ